MGDKGTHEGRARALGPQEDPSLMLYVPRGAEHRDG